MKNNYPIDDEVELLEQALLNLHEQKKANDARIRRMIILEIILLAVLSMAVGFLYGQFTA